MSHSKSHFQARVNVKENTCPVFLRPWSVLLAIKGVLEKELIYLESGGIIKEVLLNDWVCTSHFNNLKGDGKLSRDYKMTVNSHLDIDQYHLPKPDTYLLHWLQDKIFED